MTLFKDKDFRKMEKECERDSNFETLGILEAMTGFSIFLRIAQSKILNQACMQIILSYLNPSEQIRTHLLSKIFYQRHIPITL